MEQKRPILEHGEFEKLFGETPNVPAGHNNSYTGQLTHKIQSNGHLENGQGLYLPDERSIASAFSELSLNGGATTGQTMSPRRENSSLVYVPSYHSTNDVPYTADRYEESQYRPNLAKRLQQFGHIQNLSSGFSDPNAHQGSQFVPGVEFSVMSDHQPQLTKSTSHYPPLSTSNTAHWTRIQDDQCIRANPHSLYPYTHSRELQNELINYRHEYFNAPDWHRTDEDRLWNENAALRSLNKTRRMRFPERILTRSHNWLSTAKPMKNYNWGNENLNNIKQRLPVQNHIDDLSPWNFYSDTSNLKNNSLNLHLQGYDSVEEARGKIYFMAKDQHGCRFLQDKISERIPEDIRVIFCEIIDHIVELMTDPFGNYLVQKLLEACNDDQRMQVILAVTRNPGELIRISCDMHGTRAVQKVVETVSTLDQVSMVVSALKPGVENLMKNMNGNHVAQRCLQYLTPQYCRFLFEAAISHCLELATDRHGCCVLQKCLSCSEGENRQRLVSKLTSNALILSQDQFGNYCLQFVFEFQLQWAMQQIVNQLEGNYTDLSMQKFSSNVVEKCLIYGTDEHRARIIKEYIQSARIDHVMHDPFGNYVVQTALRHSKGIVNAELVNAIRPHINSLRTSPYGKRVLSALNLKK